MKRFVNILLGAVLVASTILNIIPASEVSAGGFWLADGLEGHMMRNSDTLTLTNIKGWGTTVGAARVVDPEGAESSYCLVAEGKNILRLGEIIPYGKGWVVSSMKTADAGTYTECEGTGAVVLTFGSEEQLNLFPVEDLEVGEILYPGDLLSIETFPGVEEGTIGSWGVRWNYPDGGSHTQDLDLSNPGDIDYEVWSVIKVLGVSVENDNSVLVDVEPVSMANPRTIDQTVYDGESATFELNIDPAYDGIDLRYEWWGLRPVLSVFMYEEWVDSGDGSYTTTEAYAYASFGVGPNAKVGDKVSFDYSFETDRIEACGPEGAESGGFGYSIDANTTTVEYGDVCTAGSGTVEYVLTEEDFPDDWDDMSPKNRSAALISIGMRDITDGERLTISNIRPEFGSYLNQEKIEGADKSTLTIGSDSPYYFDGADFWADIYGTSEDWEEGTYVYDGAYGVLTILPKEVGELEVDLQGITGAVVGDSITVRASAMINGVLTDVTDQTTFTSKDVATGRPDIVNGNVITFVHASEHEICATYNNMTDCQVVEVAEPAEVPSTGWFGRIVSGGVVGGGSWMAGAVALVATTGVGVWMVMRKRGRKF